MRGGVSFLVLVAIVASSPRVNYGRVQLSMTLGLQHTWFTWVCMLTATTDINTDLSCNRIMDSDMALSRSLDLFVSMVPGSSTGQSGLYGPW